MQRLMAIVLLAAAVWYGADFLRAELGASPPAASQVEHPQREAARRKAGDSTPREPVTNRVRNRVNEAIEEGTRRHTGGR